ncbi:MAG: hybrid sensor histidine kinase/response regulator [Anaerolineae bacterium]|nr:hybrid sensor histidine kinase/response regulator [Anaerolineae bacterium]
MDQGNILIVDDTPANLRLLSSMLSEQGYKVRSVLNGQMALTAAQAAPPDLVLLDIRMPDMDGYAVCEALKQDERTADIPIIFISALDATQDKVKAFTVGGVDYITKPFQFDEVLARVRTHLALRALQKELEHQIDNRDKAIAELDAYAHTVAHDLKNPLTVLLGYSTMLEKNWDKIPQEKIARNLSVIAQSSRRMTNIVNELLLLASVRQLDEVPYDSLNMETIVAEVLVRMDDMIKESRAEIIVPHHWPTAAGHGPWVEEIWVNYISNAIKYGGQPPKIKLGASLYDDGRPCFWVLDNGPGISEEDQTKLFTPFERLSQARAKGHGLGLSIVRRIVEKLGGEVVLQSKENEGSMFGFVLPPAHPA